MTQLNAYLRFNGECREALTFYKECLGGELVMQSIGESPMAGQSPPEVHQQILHGSLTTASFRLLASDMMDAAGPIKGNTFALCLDCSSAEEIQTYFTKLSAGGTVGHPLKEEFWGSTFGDLTDKFGINWLFNFDKN